MVSHALSRWLLALAVSLLFGCASSADTVDYDDAPPPRRPLGAPASDLPSPTPGAVHASADPLAAPVDVAGPPASASFTSSGLASRVLRPGTGTRKPTPRDTVIVHYTGWTTDGERFDSSVARGEPAVFPLNGVIRGWTEGLQLMVAGEKRRFWIPADLAYGDNPRPGAPAGMLVFDVELMGIR